MKRHLLLLLIAAATLSAADLSGRWTGILETSDNPVPRSDSHFAILEQKGGTLSGTAGPKRDVQWQIREAKVDGAKVSFEVEAPGSARLLMQYDLELKGDELTGTVVLKNRPGVSWNLRLKRER